MSGARLVYPGLCLVLALASALARAQDHSHHPPAKPPPAQEPVDHAAMGHGEQEQSHDSPAGTLREPIPKVTDADRAAAFPPIHAGHAAHGKSFTTFLQVDQLEAWREDGEDGLAWELSGWAGGDIERVWLRSEGERFADTTEQADVELLYGRAIARWWDLVAGVQHDFEPGDAQTFAGIGVIGLAPYKFEIEATAYVGESGQTRATLEAEYELLLTNRLILQPLVEIVLHGKDDEERGIGSGLSTLEAGLRLRYEFTRKFAPYLGVAYERAYSQTADLRRAAGEETHETIVVAGIRTWF